MGASLWEINEQIEELAEHLADPETGELDESVMGQIAQLQMDRSEKIENVCLMVKSLIAQAEAITTESKNLKARADSKMNKANWLIEYLSRNLKDEKFETEKCAISWRKSQKVEIVNEDLIPEEFCDFKTERKVRKADIKKQLKNGESVPGAVLLENSNIQIR